MASAFRTLVIVVLFSLTTFSQTTPPPSFEAADVHLSPPSPTTPFVTGPTLRGGRYEIRNATMIDLITIAHGISAEKVSGGPSWIGADRFDIVAKAPEGATLESSRRMLQTLLADRFKLRMHDDKKPLPAYALTVTKLRSEVKPAKGGDAKGCQGQGTTTEGGVMLTRVVCLNITMADLAEALPQLANAYVVNPVVDKTGIKDAFDFELRWTPRAQLALAGGSGVTLFDALDKQMGLKLESQNVDSAVVVVDGVNQKPTDNLPNIATRIPAAPTEFEVATIKPSEPGAQFGGGFQPGGRIDARGITLKMMITLGWDIDAEMISGGPKWLDSDRFDLVAKAPGGAGAAAANNNGPPIDIATLRTMLRNLVIERFQLATHLETQPVSVYTIAAPKAADLKLRKSDGSARSACTRGQAPASNPALTQNWICQNTTMEQFATMVRGWAGGYFDRKVVDATGLQGGWDFTLSWTPRPALEAASANGTVSSGMTVFEGAEKLLGLKISLQKHPMPVLVIDKAEKP
jgi:uncharacterized protein (TIGR03435 family)